ncbi:hypothetical protein NDU88_004041 [Pleurodeles waltl]|uniref:Uncharacterized protein n=1 Tax=Pleurodeles waltl TaxID=8319 RepID=A0AAV7M714_PLEWA|nr:hypothetical protein NDU88_004041 [Pleurodeles waltl]
MDSPDCTTPACVTAYVTIPSTPSALLCRRVCWTHQTARLQPASLLTSPSPAHRCTALRTRVMDSPDCTTPACVTAYVTIPSTPSALLCGRV